MGKTKATVCIVETLNFLEESTHREGEIIARTLRLSEKLAPYTYLRSVEELKAFVIEFGGSPHRYLHLSCHGDGEDFATTTGWIKGVQLADLLAPYAKNRRIFLSSCLAAGSKFAERLLDRSDCLSVLAPIGKIKFDDAAIFWSSFYHLMFKEDPNSMTRQGIIRNVERCAPLVREKFRLFYKLNGKVRKQDIG